MKPEPSSQPEQQPNVQNRVFVVLMMITHVLICVMYGLFGKVSISSQSTTDLSPAFMVFCHAMCVIVGFGLLFAYLKNAMFSSLGFVLLIVPLTLELYLLFCAFWGKAGILQGQQPLFHHSDKSFPIYLTNLSMDSTSASTLTAAFRCAIVNIIAFSAILGRAGPLQIYILTVFGTLGFELNRQVVQNLGMDMGGGTIFVFGGCMGAGIALLKTCREKDPTTENHYNYAADPFSAMCALLGSLVVWVFLPTVLFDHPSQISTQQPRIFYSLYYSLAASTLMSILISTIRHSPQIGIKDLIYGSIGGGIASFDSAVYVTNPVFGIITGMVGGFVQVGILHACQRKSGRVWQTFAMGTFAIQGIIGAAFAAGWNAIAYTHTNGFTMQSWHAGPPAFQLWTALLSAGMGLGFGLAGGLLVMIVADTFEQEDYFEDEKYWETQDSIGFQNIKDEVPKLKPLEQLDKPIRKSRYAYM